MSQDAHNPTGGALPPPREMIDAYLDGELRGERLTAFERALENDTALRAEVESQRSIDDSLGRLFHRAAPVPLPGASNGTPGVGAVSAVPAAPSLRLAGEPSANGVNVGKASKGPFRVGWGWLAAAAVTLTVAGLYYTGVLDPVRWVMGEDGLVNPAVVYENKVKSGFMPDWVCENDEEFLKTTRDMWREEFLVKSTDEVKVVGWSYYDHVFSPKTAILLATVGSEKVIVAIDSKNKDRRIRLPETSGLKAYKRVVGDVVMVEISPLDEPKVVPLVELQ